MRRVCAPAASCPCVIAPGCKVHILGVPCLVTAHSATTVTCVTGAYGPTNQTHDGKGAVQLKVPGKGYATAAEDAYWYVDLWSRTTTWGGGPLPIEGDSVVIDRGQTVLLDVSPPQLVVLVVMGRLIFDRRDLALDAGYMMVLGDGALFQVGTEEEPFLHSAVITLHGHIKSPELPVYGSKVLAVRQGTLDLHGAPSLRSWTLLARTAIRGAQQLHLQQPVDWCIGCRIVVAPTDFEKEHAEELTITHRDATGRILTLSRPLQWVHRGETHTVAGVAVELRAEVGLLSRNVRVQGNVCEFECSGRVWEGVGDGFDRMGAALASTECLCTADYPDKITPQAKGELTMLYGAHIMMHSAGEDSLVARLENLELKAAGQAGRLGRYPIHFHMIGVVQQSYVRNCSVHHTFNRAVAVHGVHQLRVQDNVAYHTTGHTFFIEDAIETKNVFERNLGILAMPLHFLLNTDQTPAMFWVTNPDNI